MSDNVPFTSGSMFGRTATSPDANAFAATSGGADGTNKLWLPVWSGEVMTAYDQYRAFAGMTETRTISSGRVAEFPIMGTVALKSAWGAGEELIGNTNDNTSKTIAIQLDARPIATHFELDNIDVMISQWEFRSELARQAGQTMANARDLQLGAYLVRAGAESVLSDDPRLAGSDWRGTVKNSPLFEGASYDDLGSDSASDAERSDAALALLRAIEEFQVHLQEIEADSSNVFCAVTPRAFHDIRALGVAREASDLAGGAGRPMFGGVADAGGLGAGLTNGMMNIADRLEYMGVTIVKTNHLPNFNAGASGYEIGEDRYNLDFATAAVKAVIWQPKAVASLSLTGLKVDTVDDIRRNSVFTVASMMAGTGVLRPECASVVRGTGSGTGRSALQTDLGMSAEFANVS
jgi:hypothetical protein